MAQAGHGLMIKYGLPKTPTEQEVALWIEKADELKRGGATSEAAGASAARLVFVGVGTMTYASESDAIESLLDAARNKK